MAFLMLMTSCYSYKEVKSSEKSTLEVGDKVKIVTNDRKYKRVIIESVNDSIVTVEEKKHHSYWHYQIETDSITNLYKRQFNAETTVGWIIVILLTTAIIAFLASDFSGLAGAWSF